MLRWAKAQGAVTGYAHSGSGLEVDPAAATKRLLAALDRDSDGSLTRPRPQVDCFRSTSPLPTRDRDGVLSRSRA